MVQCVYKQEDQERLGNAIIDAIKEPLFDAMNNPDRDEPQHDEDKASITRKAMLAAAAMKHPGFEGEAEWRLVKPSLIGWQREDKVKFRPGRCGLVPYLCAPMKLTNGQLVPEAIHIVPNEDMQSARAALKTFLVSRKIDFLNDRVKIRESQTPYRP